MIPFHSTPILFNISQTNSPPSSACNSKRNSFNFNTTNLKPKSNSFSSSKDSEWLTLEICREFLRGECLRDEFSCRYAHPSKSIETQNGRVICCYDYLKGKCHRHKPPCKYLHPPIHLKEQLLQKGKTNLIMKNLHYSFISTQQPANMSRSQSTIPYNLNSISVTSPRNLSQSHNLKTAIQMPMGGNLQSISYVPSPVPYVIIPSVDSHSLSNIQYTHMAIETTQIDSNHKQSLQKSSFMNPLQTCGGISAAQTSALSPYQSLQQQQYSFRKSYCIPYQPVLLKNWPLYTYATVPY